MVGDVGEAVVGVVGVVGESGVGTRGSGVSHRGRLLELDIDTASRGVFDGPFGLAIELVGPQAVARRSQGGELGTGARATQPSDKRMWPHAVHDGGRHCVDVEKWGRVCVRLRASAERFLRAKQGMCVFGKECSLSGTEAKVFAFVSIGC